jgi:hypothetical protein
MKKSLTLIFFSFFTFGFSQDWKFIFESNDQSYYYKPNTENTAWIKVVSEKIEYYPNKASNKKSVVNGSEVLLWKFDCESKKLGLLQMNIYSKSAKLLSSLNINEYLVEMNYVTPDSIGEGIFKVFCDEN